MDQDQSYQPKTRYRWKQPFAQSNYIKYYIILKQTIKKYIKLTRFLETIIKGYLSIGLDYIVGLSSQYGQFHAIQALFQEYGKIFSLNYCIWALNKNSLPGVNFTNILRAAFSYESFSPSFFVLRFKVCTFWRKNIGAKAASNMLVKLTPGWQKNIVWDLI